MSGQMITRMHPDPAQMASSDPSFADLRARALRLLGQRDHSRLELARKLQGRGCAAASVDAILDDLESNGLLQEDRFVEAYVAERLGKGFGPLRVRAELQARGIADQLIEAHLDLDDEECFALMQRADRKHAASQARRRPEDAAADNDRRPATARRARFLEYRGFPSHLIARLLCHDDCFSP